MRALVTAVVYFGSFLAIGLTAKLVAGGWMNRRNLDLSEIQAQVGPRRGKRRIFLLGFWRDEGPDRVVPEARAAA
jgi:hypothetical protein